MQSSTLNRTQREEVLRALSDKVRKHLHAPRLESIDWDEITARHITEILDAPDDARFEKAVTQMLAELKSSHVGFYRRDLKRCSAKAVLGASYSEITESGTSRWVFQNVHPGGPAALGGVRAGDVLVS